MSCDRPVFCEIAARPVLFEEQLDPTVAGRRAGGQKLLAQMSSPHQGVPSQDSPVSGGSAEATMS